MDKKLKELLLEVLKDIIPYVRGILVYGSFIKGYKRYDIVVFNAISWYLRGEILENNEVIYAEDDADPDFWLYKQLKIWIGMKRRQGLVSTDDLIGRVKEGRIKTFK